MKLGSGRAGWPVAAGGRSEKLSNKPNTAGGLTQSAISIRISHGNFSSIVLGEQTYAHCINISGQFGI